MRNNTSNTESSLEELLEKFSKLTEKDRISLSGLLLDKFYKLLTGYEEQIIEVIKQYKQDYPSIDSITKLKQLQEIFQE
ncbi:MAG: hypothetical protein AAF195_04420, partial [Pseudomonadota bacterium]